MTPLRDRMTFHLPLGRGTDDALSGSLFNPESNFGRFFDVERVVLRDGRVRLEERGLDHVRIEGPYYPAYDLFSFFVPDAGGTFDFVRLAPGETSTFFARSGETSPYTYTRPPGLDDGWAVAAPEDVGLDATRLEHLVRHIVDTPADSLAAPHIHAVLVARHGKLVLEEYFHGFTREDTHDTRSASKTVTATLVGLARHAGADVGPETPVYRTMYGDELPDDLDPRKLEIRLEHLLTMAPGLACDDNDDDSPGSEWRMQSQTDEPDWYRYTLELPVANAPGMSPAYCSASTNLVGGVLSRATGRWLPDVFRDLFARPLGLETYHMNLMPSGDAYGGGGLQIRARDFLKLGQIFLDDGMWRGKRLLDGDWVRDALRPHQRLFDQGYGYGWWIMEMPYGDRTVTACYAGGNGGQYVMIVPELDVALVFFGGNYGQRATHAVKTDHVPRFILPAVLDGE